MRIILLTIALFIVTCSVKADEGMWLLKELNKESISRMKELGFSFPTNAIYSETNPSLKDAVVIFGGGCTGVVVSNQGLIFTNHHCGYGVIQKLSSVKNDYLKNGFASQSNSEELRAEGLQVSFLKSMDDITSYVLAGLDGEEDEEVRYAKIDSLSVEYLKRYEDDEFLNAKAVPFYTHNKYYVAVYEVFTDVRLVFAPPSSIGKFGGETDNWMWPRHTGDFSAFRVYANQDNEAASYSENNVPYKPKYSVPISIKGYKENDYAMTIGYPGRTQRYLASWGIEQMVESEHKPRIEVRGAKQNIWKKHMNANDTIRIKYASKYAGSSNYWKNAMGMNEAIAKMDVMKGKGKIESDFAKWVLEKSDRQEKYGNTLTMLQESFENTMDFAKTRTYLYETFLNGIEVIRLANTVLYVNEMKDIDTEDKKTNVRGRLTNMYKDYEPKLDKEVMPVLLKLYGDRVPAEFLPDVYQIIEDKFDGDYNKYTEWVFDNSKMTDLDNAISILDSENIEQDPAVVLARSLTNCIQKIGEAMALNETKKNKGNRLYMAGLMEMNTKKVFYPDANFTQRLSYGSIAGYKPADAIVYEYYTTSQGVLNKQVPNDPEFNVQNYILDDLQKENFGPYADKDGKMHVNFLSNNDITGGNSGSPVFNRKAELIGLAFDGNWEALSGDILFNQEVQRCINVDIRYALYIIDKVMNCPRLIQELKIVK